MPKPTHAEVLRDPLGDADEPLPPIPDLDAELDPGLDEELEASFDALEETPEPRPSPPRGGSILGAVIRRRRTLVLTATVVVAAGALLAYRSHQRQRVLAEGLERARAALRLDTAAGYREAASLLEPLVELDPLRAGSVRAFALGMLFADYRDEGAAEEAERLLVVPTRAKEVPADANLAAAALALGRREAGNAMTAATRASAAVEAQVLSARVALLAGNLQAAAEPAAAAADAGLPAGHALVGDLLRRTRRDPAAARTAYLLALERSTSHARAAYGLAKLALSGHGAPAEATAVLHRVAADPATLAPERGRAALHLAALRLRGGDLAAARAALDEARLEPAARAWAEKAAHVEAANHGPFRAVEGAPPPLRSASDDDPPVLPPVAPASAEPRPAAPAAKAGASKPPARKASAKAAAGKRTAAKATTRKASAAKAAKQPARKKSDPARRGTTAARTSPR